LGRADKVGKTLERVWRSLTCRRAVGYRPLSAGGASCQRQNIRLADADPRTLGAPQESTCGSRRNTFRCATYNAWAWQFTVPRANGCPFTSDVRSWCDDTNLTGKSTASWA